MPRPLAPKLERMLADRARKIERRAVQKRAQGGHYRAADGRSAPSGNVIALKPQRRAPVATSTSAPPPEHSILSMSPIELRNHESTLVECLNGALIEGITEMRAMLADPYVPDERKLRVFAHLTAAKRDLTRVHAKAQRIAAAETDLQHAAAAERSAFQRHQEALRLVNDGWTVTEPSGRKIVPRDRSPQPVED